MKRARMTLIRGSGILSKSRGFQQYPLGTQEKYNSFPVMKDDVKTVVNERRGGGKGEPGVPPTLKNKL